MAQQPVGVADQRIYQGRAGLGVVPGNLRLARVVIVVPGAVCRDDRCGPGTSRRTRRIAAISWVTVSWVATASVRIVESNARRGFPLRAPLAASTSRTASKIRFGRCERASRRRQ